MVGAYVEEVAPRRILHPADAGFLAVLLIVSFGIHAWLVGHTFVTARDSMRFARIALNLESPNARDASGHRSVIDVMKDSRECPDPPLFPLIVLAASKLVGLVSQASLPVQMLLSVQVASSLAAVLLVLPTYWLGRMLFASRSAGFAAALLFQSLPTVAHITSDGLSDSTSMLCIITTLVCAVRALRTWSTKWFLFAGIAGGCGYLVRPEAMIGVPALGLVTLVMLYKQKHTTMSAAGRLTALMVGLLVVAVPYMALIGGVSNKPSVNEPLKKLLPLRMLTSQAKIDCSPVLVAEWYSGRGSQKMWAIGAITRETVKASHYVPFGLGLLGLIWFRRRLDASFGVVLVAGLIQFVLLFGLAMKPMQLDLGPGSESVPPYVSERHTLLLVYLLCLFTGGLLKPLAEIISPFKHGGFALLMALVAGALPAALKPLHENRAGHYYAGQFLHGVIGPHDAVIDPFEWAHYYAGYSLYGMPPDPADSELITRWVVWEPTAGTKQNPHSRLPRLEAAHQVIADTRNPAVIVFQWPATVAIEEAKVVVYKQIVKR